MVQASEADEMVVQDLPQALSLFKEMRDHVQKVTQLVDNVLLRVKSGEISTAKGLSFLEMKYHMLLEYLINITYTILRKCSGQKIEGDPAINRLVEIRTVLEKIRPLDQKLKYQVDKLVKTAVTGIVSGDDPLMYRPRPENLVPKLKADENEKEKSDEESTINKPKGKYVPPKIAAVHYDEDIPDSERKQRLLEKARKKALSSSLLQDLKDEYLDTPTEIYDMADTYKARISKDMKEREEYEEAHLRRLPISRHEKHKLHQISTLGSLGNELTRFGNLSALADDDDDIAGPSVGKKRKLTKGKANKGKKKGFKKRRRN